MTRAIKIFYPLVLRGVGIPIANQDHERRARRLPLKNPREDFCSILFFPRGAIAISSGPPPRELFIDIGLVQKEPCGTSINDHSNSRSVRLAKCGDPKDLPKKIRGHHLFPLFHCARKYHARYSCSITSLSLSRSTSI